MNALLALCALLGAAAARAETAQELEASVQRRVQKTSGGPDNALFEEYGEKPNGFILERYGLESDAGGFSLEAQARRPGQNDGSARLSFGVPGRFSCKASFDKTPHLYSREARSLWRHQGGGVMDFPDSWQLYYQTVDVSTSVNPGQAFNDPASTTGIRSVLDSAPYIPLAVSVETMSLDLRLRPAGDLVVELGGLRQAKRGARPQGASFGFKNAVELAAPVDQVAREAYASARLEKRRLQLGAEYRLSEFDNRLPTLAFDNPKRLDDRAVGTHITQGDGGARGAIAQAPSNRAHSLSVQGGLALTEEARLSWEGGYRLWTQSSPLLPYTQNTAMSDTNPIPEGSFFYTPPFRAADPANLPAAAADARIEVYTYMARLTGRPFAALRASLTHDAYILENKSARYAMPGFAVADQTWYGVPFTTPAQQYRRDKTSLKGDWELTPRLSAQLGVSHTYLKRTREVSKSREDEASLGLTLRPSRALVLSAAASAARRRAASAFEFGSLPTTKDAAGRPWYTQAPGLRRNDVADRDRREGRVSARWAAGEASASVNARLTHDRYLPSDSLNGRDPLVVPEFFGTLSERQEAASAGVSLPLSETLSADAYYDLERAARRVRSVIFNHASESGGAGGAWVHGQLPGDRWAARVIEKTHAAGLALAWQASPRLKTTLGYDLTFTRHDVDPVENGKDAGELLAFKTFPSTRRMLQALRARAERRVSRLLTLTAGASYEKFDAADWGYDEVPLRDAGSTAIYLGNSLRDYRAYTASLGARLTF